MSEFYRAVKYSQQWQYEFIAKRIEINNDINLDDLDNEELADHIHWEHSRHLSTKNTHKLNDKVGELRVNLGLDHDWTHNEFKGPRCDNRIPPEEYTNYLKDIFYGSKSNGDDELLLILTRGKDEEYSLTDLNPEQQMVVICALQSVVKFLTNDPTYKPLHATAIGCGGTCKSQIVNTLITMVRKYTRRNGTA